MSESVNVIRLHVLNLVCLILVAFLLFSQHCCTVSGYVASYILFRISSPGATEKEYGKRIFPTWI